jgi:hypothetical protein
MLTITYAKNDEIAVYCGEIESTTDYLITIKLASKNGTPVASGKPQYRSFDREQIQTIQTADGKFISKNAEL